MAIPISPSAHTPPSHPVFASPSLPTRPPWPSHQSRPASLTNKSVTRDELTAIAMKDNYGGARRPYRSHGNSFGRGRGSAQKDSVRMRVDEAAGLQMTTKVHSPSICNPESPLQNSQTSQDSQSPQPSQHPQSSQTSQSPPRLRSSQPSQVPPRLRSSQSSQPPCEFSTPTQTSVPTQTSALVQTPAPAQSSAPPRSSAPVQSSAPRQSLPPAPTSPPAQSLPPAQSSPPSQSFKSFQVSQGLFRTGMTPSDASQEERSLSSQDTVRPFQLHENQFIAFNIPAYPTRAFRNEVCRDFVNPRIWCQWGSKCNRVHPLDKATHWQKIRELYRLQESSSAASFGANGKAKGEAEEQQGDAISQEPTQLAPTRARSPPTCTESPPTRPQSPASKPETGSVQSLGWDSTGSWMAVSAPEAWASSSSDHGSSDKLLSSPSGSSPATSVGDSSEGDQDKPVFSRHNPFASVCAVWKKTGSCRRGDTCRFKHQLNGDSGEGSSQSAAVSMKSTVTESNNSRPTSAIQHPRPRTGVCRNWLRNECTLGYGCRFVHEDLEYDDGPADKPASNAGASSQLTRGSVSSSLSNSPDEYIFTITLHEHIRVQCTAGFDIHNIQTAFESSTLLLSNISSRLQPGRLRELVNSYGRVEDLRMPLTLISPGSVVMVTYSDASEAQKAQSAFNGMRFFGSSVTARIAANNNIRTVATALLKDTSVRISWEAPAKEAYAGYPDEEQALKAIHIARYTPLHGHYMKATIHDGIPAVDMVTVRFQGVPIEVDEKDMVRFADPTDIMWTRPKYKQHDGVHKFVNAILHKDGAQLEQFEILPPPYRDGGIVRAWATFASATEAKAAARRLDGRKPSCTGLTPIRAKHVQTLTYSLPSERYAGITTAVELLQASLRGSFAGVTVHRSSGPVYVRISAEEQKGLARLKVEFEGILKGEMVQWNGKVAWDGYFSRDEGIQFLRNLGERYPAVRIENNILRGFIRLYGLARHRSNVRAFIIDQLKLLQSRQASEIPLPGWILGAVLTHEDLIKLQKQHGRDNIALDMRKRVLLVRGDGKLHDTIKSIVDEISQRFPSSTKYDGPTCPVCLDRPTSPVRLKCGHSWCRACLTSYFRAAIEQATFPLKCLGKEGRCATKIPIAAAREMLPGDALLALVNAAFLAYIHARPREFHFCPTPDCPQVYRATAEKATLQCPSCLAGICTRCHAEAHDGFDCVDQAQDALFEQWLKDHDVKNCPTCKIPIERSEGCNHMTCTRCQTHICWQCMKTFPGGEGIYGHMKEVHGTFGLGPIID